jgi:hypothetical protein
VNSARIFVFGRADLITQEQRALQSARLSGTGVRSDKGLLYSRDTAAVIRHDLSTTVLNKCSVQPAYAQGLIPQVVQARFRQAGMRGARPGRGGC